MLGIPQMVAGLPASQERPCSTKLV